MTQNLALIRETHKFITKKFGGFLDDQTQERNAGERKDRIQVYPSVVLRFYKRRREDDKNATRCLASYCEPAFRQWTSDVSQVSRSLWY